jgi:hypothetical protein
MTWSVYQHWDPLKVCIVGRSYPPEFYSWITVPHVRNLFERIAIETEEDYQGVIKKLQQFGVEVLRPELPRNTQLSDGRHIPPPMTPRDRSVMIGDTFYCNFPLYNFGYFYWNAKKPDWPHCNSAADMLNLPVDIQKECIKLHSEYCVTHNESHDHIVERIRQQGNGIKTYFHGECNGAMVSRIGRDLYFSTMNYNTDIESYQRSVDKEFTQTRNHIVNTGGPGDGTYCPVAPGLIISLMDVPTYTDTFPGWEVVYLPGQSWDLVSPFLRLKEKNKGKWWIPGFEDDANVINVVEQWLGHWTGYVEETVFDVNMLIIDPKNVLVFNYNKQVFDALDRYGITPHIVPFRHRYFWDGGIHCITSDLHREGTMQNYFPKNHDLPIC